MQCKICDKERPLSKFNSDQKIRICDDCIELMGYNHQRMGERIYRHYQKTFDKALTEKVQQTLPSVMEKLMIESDLIFELKVI